VATYNTALGPNALLSNTTGQGNTALGINALLSSINGSNNTAVGGGVLVANTGQGNTALGVIALYSNTTGGQNPAVGRDALESNSIGSNNIALGDVAGANLMSRDNNIYIGHPGPAGPTGESRTIRIGESGVHTRTYLVGTIFVNDVQQFPPASDARFKTNVTPLTHVLEKLEQLRGVSFEWNEASAPLTGHTPGQRDIGVIAQEVEAVFPELVTTWGDEGYKAVAYEKLTGVLIAAVKELKAEKDTQQQHIVALETRLAAMEQTVAAPQPPGRLSFSSLWDGYPLFGGATPGRVGPRAALADRGPAQVNALPTATLPGSRGHQTWEIEVKVGHEACDTETGQHGKGWKLIRHQRHATVHSCRLPSTHYSSGGCHPARTQFFRTVIASALFNRNTRMVARLHGVNPTISVPSALQVKCSDHVSCRGLNSATCSPLTESRPWVLVHLY
jgi:hypothetical protein